MEENKVAAMDEFEMVVQKCDSGDCDYDCKPNGPNDCDSFWTTLF